MAPVSRALMKYGSQVHLFWYTITGGIFGARVSGAPVLLLTTTGRKSGRSRTTPLSFLQDGENKVIVGSNGGNDQHPAWYHNLRVNPDAEVRVGREKTRVRAEVAGDDERARLWPLVVQMYHGYDEYQKETKRQIPLVILRPVAN
jgi:deazaflavin-dependent oxidoreductase (nitroreductase family)